MFLTPTNLWIGLHKFKILLCIPSPCITAFKIKTTTAGASLKKKRNLQLCSLHSTGSQRWVKDVLPWIAEEFWDYTKWTSSSRFNHTHTHTKRDNRQIFADVLLPRPFLHCRRTRKGNQLCHTPQVNLTGCTRPFELHFLNPPGPLLSTMPREWRLFQSCW